MQAFVIYSADDMGPLGEMRAETEADALDQWQRGIERQHGTQTERHQNPDGTYRCVDHSGKAPPIDVAICPTQEYGGRLLRHFTGQPLH